MFISDQALLIRLLLGHFVSDFVFQSQKMVEGKTEYRLRSRALYLHGAIYAVIVFALSGAWKQAGWMLPCLFATHVLLDGWKATRPKKAAVFLFDQLAHLIVLAGVFLLLARTLTGPAGELFRGLWQSTRILGIALAYLLVLWPGGRLIGEMTEPFRQQLNYSRSRGLAKAGLWIGCLERAFVLSFVLLNQLSGVALLLGLKSLFRFGEIKDPQNRKETEYILIGTMLSFGFAFAIGIAVKTFLKSLS